MNEIDVWSTCVQNQFSTCLMSDGDADSSLATHTADEVHVMSGSDAQLPTTSMVSQGEVCVISQRL